MLEIIKTTQFKGNSKIGTEVVKVFEASINTTNPENITLNSYVVDYDSYKVNRATILTDQTSFEDSVYAFQAQLIAEQVPA